MSEDARPVTTFVVTGALAVAALVLVAAAALVLRPDSTTATDSTLAPLPSMEPVKPVAERVAPAAPSRGTDRSASPVATDWVATVSRQTRISTIAIEAYGRASLRLAEKQAGCHLGWTTLAGIGAIESGHGTYGGARLLADSTTNRPITGPALDGKDGVAAIPSDSDSERWHGDPKWDHAVGPMQFIPSTWRTWGSDGNGDGSSDPNNIADAAYAAGRYLCASGGDLATGEGWTRAIFAYNHSSDYVRSVLARADSYVAAVR